jgi:hypothetical protein
VTRFSGRCLLTLALAGLLHNVAWSDGPSPDGIIDGLDLFRPEVAARADALIRDMREKYRFDVRVETLVLPDDERLTVERMPKQKAKAEYFTRLGIERADKAGVNGLYILICLNPRYIQVTTYPDSTAALLSRNSRKQLHDLLQRGLRGAKADGGHVDAAEAAAGFGWRARPPTGPDAALLETLQKVNAILYARAGNPNAVAPVSIGIVLAAGVGLWFVLTLLQRRLAKRAPDSGIAGPGQPDRGPALLAARFGSTAALWIYDRLFYGPPDLPAVASAPAESREMPAVAIGSPSDLLHPEPDHVDAVAHKDIG